MDTVESDPADTPIVAQIARVALLSVMIAIAAWLVTDYAFNSLGATFFN